MKQARKVETPAFLALLLSQFQGCPFDREWFEKIFSLLLNHSQESLFDRE